LKLQEETQPIDLVLLGIQANRREVSVLTDQMKGLIAKITSLFPTTPLLLESEYLSASELDACKQLMVNRDFLSYPIRIRVAEVPPMPSSVAEVVAGRESEDEDEDAPNPNELSCHEIPLAKVNTDCSDVSSELRSKDEQDEQVISFRAELVHDNHSLKYSFGELPINHPSISDMVLLRNYLFERAQYRSIEDMARSRPAQGFDTARRELDEAKQRVIKTAQYQAWKTRLEHVVVGTFGGLGLLIFAIMVIGYLATDRGHTSTDN
jgi:hypothetical protein